MFFKKKDSEVVVRLAGGLGNQIFQLGAGLLLADIVHAKSLILDDSSLASYQVKRVNNLTKFFDFEKLDLEIDFHERDLNKFRIPKLIPVNHCDWPFVSDNNFSSVLTSKYSSSRYLDGYFQSCLTQYEFDDISRILNRLLSLDLSPKDMYSCVIHIRGGDFLDLAWNTVSPPEYYHSAVTKMLDLRGIKKFIVVTDDNTYASSLMSNIDCDYQIESSNIVADFRSIASIPNRILSSSTFALWASTLGCNTESTVIIPQYLKPNLLRPFELPGEIKISF